MSLSEKYKELQLQTIQSQYGASSRILSLTEGFAGVFDPTDDVDLFYEKVFDISTAVGWGLENWGRILAQPRSSIVADIDYFGFYNQDLNPFNQAPFFSGTSSDIDSYQLSDVAYRQLLLFKAMANISDSTAATINSLLKSAFPETFVALIDNQDMSVSLLFKGNLDDYEIQLLDIYGSFIKGAGVGWGYIIENTDEIFGFDDSDLMPFDQGIFGDDLTTT